MNPNDISFKKENSIKELNYTIHTSFEGLPSELFKNESDCAEEVDGKEFEGFLSRNNSVLVFPPSHKNQSIEAKTVSLSLTDITFISTTNSKETNDSQTERKQNQDQTNFVNQDTTHNSTTKNEEGKECEENEDENKMDSTSNTDSKIEKRNQDINITKTSIGKSTIEEKKDEEEGKGKNVIKERANGAQVDKSGVYNYKDSGIGDSYLIGTDYFIGSSKETWANAFVKGLSACPEVLNIPGELTSKNGKTKPVEIIGTGAFNACGNYNDHKGETKSVKIPWQVKIIKERGLNGMNNLESFEIEAGSQLKTIELKGLSYIGYYTVDNYLSKRNSTLVLPSNLSSVYEYGIDSCNIFHTIIYCGSHLLSNTSDLDNSVSPDTVVKVTSRYPFDEKIFGRSPNRSSQTEAEAESECKKMNILPKITPMKDRFSPQKSTSRFIPLLTGALLSSQSKQKKDIRERLKIQLLL